jgi:hypothetical protein
MHRYNGADILPQSLYVDNRIESFLCDQSNEIDLKNLIKNIGEDIDVIIDDGSHKAIDQIFTCKTLMPLVKKDVVYIIEDVSNTKTVMRHLTRENYECWLPDLNSISRDDHVVVITNKAHESK